MSHPMIIAASASIALLLLSGRHRWCEGWQSKRLFEHICVIARSPRSRHPSKQLIDPELIAHPEDICWCILI